jgi:hypothetical protein
MASGPIIEEEKRSNVGGGDIAFARASSRGERIAKRRHNAGCAHRMADQRPSSTSPLAMSDGSVSFVSV